jgi:CPA2 family monovalent cation:H+ antiporter-2
MSGTLILVAVLTSIFTPIAFKKLFPKEVVTNKRISVAFLGANQTTLPVSRELKSGLYDPIVYHTQKESANSLFEIVEIPDYTIGTLEKTKVFQSEVVVISTGDEKVNAALSITSKEKGVSRVIARIESPELEESLREHNIEMFSAFTSTQVLLRALIESPTVMNILTNQETGLYEIRMLNKQFDGMSLRQFPFTGDIIFVRIFRRKDSIVPHGDTELQINDRLIVTGSKEYVDELKRELEFCETC